MDSQLFVERLAELEKEKSQLISMVQQHTAIANQYAAQAHATDGAILELRKWLEKSEKTDEIRC